MEAIIGDQKIKVDIDKGSFYINDEKVNPDIQAIGEKTYSVILNHKVYDVEIIAGEGKKLDIKVNGATYLVQLKDKLDLTLEKMGIDQTSQKLENEIKAPMPGLILQTFVNEGDTVSKGDPLLILEAMKMENVIKSTMDGEVSKIEVSIGDSVDKGKILCRF